MKQQPKNRTALSLTAASVVLLAACGSGGGDGGGGGGGNGSAPGDPLVGGTDIPTSATTSAAGAFAFVNRVAGNKDDTAEPLRVGDATLATSDTDEPASL